ncbi:MAG: hypothetical protein IPJ14_06835 [Kineosporiaceae bacterium]|nr:hypothetical protein [Kineosporiaceae bacterium]MBK7622380.1 hypothetical protein [Kineosporiaceae bacterium]MBK8074709.1 hypothetical protein [Kineosporiaceae bacterium]
MIRRIVRATPDFFAVIDAQLGDERGANDEPTSAEFEAYELLAIVEKFATGWDTLPEQFPGRPEYRLLIQAGRVVPMIAVVGQLAPDGAVELVDITIDLDGPWA